MRKTGIYILIITLVMCCSRKENNPKVEISNGILKAWLYLPDSNDGYYRGTRFDWSGNISSLEYGGHTFFGKWRDTYSPTAHHASMGPVDSFDPLSYNETKTGETFVKIGVGVLTKPSDLPYDFSTVYPIRDPGTWKTRTKAARIQFLHILNDKDYPYEYTKTIELVEGKPEMKISYNLKNTGKEIIETQVFNHNFFVFDQHIIGAGFELIFKRDISCSVKGKGFGDIAEFQKNKLKIKRTLAENESVYCPSMKGLTNSADDYHIEIYCQRTGTGVRVRGDKPISKLAFWCSGNTICPEPYISIRIGPGQEFFWENTYEFYISQ